MDILHIGTVCNKEHYERIIKKCGSQPTIAPLVFETALLNGVVEKLDGSLSVLSCPVVQTLPRGRIIGWGKHKEKINEKLSCTWVPTINISGLKELFQIRSLKRLIKQWLSETSGHKERVVTVYGINEMAGAIQTLCRKNKVKCVCIVADLPGHCYFAGRKLGLLKKCWAALITKKYIKSQSNFDGYVYLTKAMQNVVAPGKPFCVIEGIADTSINESVLNVSRSEKPSILYAGTLAERYGIKLLIDAFEFCKGDYELWICGSGDYEKSIQLRTLSNPKIKYLGRMTHSEALELERKAHLLINIRSNTDEYTKYSFPSKNMEYMLSGTPVASTKLEGIPEEYFKYIYTIHNQKPEEIADEIDTIMNDDLRWDIGIKAKEFINREKSERAQGEKMLDFISKWFDSSNKR